MASLPSFSGQSEGEPFDLYLSRLQAYLAVNNVTSEASKRDLLLLSLTPNSFASLWSAHRLNGSFDSSIALLKAKFGSFSAQQISIHAARNRLEGRIFRGEATRSEMVIDLVADLGVLLLKAGVSDPEDARQVFMFPVCMKLLSKASSYENAIIEALRWEALIIRKSHPSMEVLMRRQSSTPSSPTSRIVGDRYTSPRHLSNGDFSPIHKINGLYNAPMATPRGSVDSNPDPRYQNVRADQFTRNEEPQTSPPHSPLPQTPTSPAHDRPLSQIDLSTATELESPAISAPISSPPPVSKRASYQSIQRVPVPRLPSSSQSPTTHLSPNRPSLAPAISMQSFRTTSDGAEFVSVREDLSRQPSRESIASSESFSPGQFSDVNASGATFGESPSRLEKDHPYVRNVPIIPFPISQRPPTSPRTRSATTVASVQSPSRPPTRTPPKKLRRRSVDTKPPRTRTTSSGTGQGSDKEGYTKRMAKLGSSIRRRLSRSSHDSMSTVEVESSVVR